MEIKKIKILVFSLLFIFFFLKYVALFITFFYFRNQCGICKKIFDSRQKLRSHHLCTHAEKTLACDQCPKSFKSRRELKLHSVCHSSIPTYKCKECDASFRFYGLLYRHRRKIHIADLQCCGKFFSSERFYNKHRLRHVSVKCEFCSKIFANWISLSKHQRLVHKEGYQQPTNYCKICDRSYKVRQAYLRHERVEHRGIKFLCEICGKEVTSQTSLRDHLRTHTGEKPFGCSYCEKKFKSKRQLETHVRVHTKEKPFECKECKKKFTQGSTLTVHIRSVHTKERPFECPICPKKFVTKTLLGEHLKKHSKKGV